MRRVIVIGCPGGGKSTFARKLRDKSGLPLYYLDMLWHKPDRTNISEEEFDCKLNEIVEKEEWIIDGNYLRSMKMRLEACDTVFFLDYPLEICLEGAKSRIGVYREDMPWDEKELDEEFLEYIRQFPKEQLPKIYKLLEEYKDKKEIVIFTSREETEQYVTA